MIVEIHELALKEFSEVIEYYDIQLKGLGDKFKKAIITQIKNIKKNPTWYLIEDGNICSRSQIKLKFRCKMKKLEIKNE